MAGASLALAPVVVVTAEHSLPLIPLLLLPILALYKGGRQAALNEYQALHDDLTKLPNRVLLHDRVQQSILGMDRDKTLVAMMLMDLDRFKEVNDTLGHHSGNLLLRQIGPPPPLDPARERHDRTPWNMHQDEDDAVIVRSTIDLGRNLGLEVVAEGVETLEHWDRLTELECDMAQGYFLSRPIPAGEFMQWLRDREATLSKVDHLHT